MITAKIVQRMYRDFWLISAQLHKQICDRIFAGNALSFVEVDVKEVKPSVDGETAIIPIKGVIGKGLCDMEKAFGMVDVDDVSEMVQWAMEDDSIKSVMFDIASPGGTVSGVPELAEQIRELGKMKPTVSYTEDMACSAAYWIGSQAYAFMASKSAQVGSIGVYLPFTDMSRMAEMQGIKVDVIKAGKFKGAGIPGTSLTEDQRTMLQDRVDYIHSEFKGDVKAMRSVRDEDMEGQDFFAPLGLKAKLIDDITDYKGALQSAKMLVKK
jgi:signal peptide peptidase SppA